MRRSKRPFSLSVDMNRRTWLSVMLPMLSGPRAGTKWVGKYAVISLQGGAFPLRVYGLCEFGKGHEGLMFDWIYRSEYPTRRNEICGISMTESHIGLLHDR